MAEGFLPSGAGTVLDALVAAYQWMKLHIGAPGAAGTSNPATETTRKQVSSWNATGSDGIVENITAPSWTGIAGSEDATHTTFWTASTAGNVGMSGTVTANPYTAGDTLSFAAGAIVAGVTLAS